MDGTDDVDLGGRPTDYDPKYCQKALKLCENGATDDELADYFKVSARTIYRWKNSHPEFCQSVTVGKELADQRVERSLYQMACGGYYTEQQAIKVKRGQYDEEVEVVDVERFKPAEFNAASFWLKNRKRESWRDKTDLEMSGPNGTPLVPVINVSVGRDQSQPALQAEHSARKPGD